MLEGVHFLLKENVDIRNFIPDYIFYDRRSDLYKFANLSFIYELNLQSNCLPNYIQILKYSSPERLYNANSDSNSKEKEIIWSIGIIVMEKFMKRNDETLKLLHRIDGSMIPEYLSRTGCSRVIIDLLIKFLEVSVEGRYSVDNALERISWINTGVEVKSKRNSIKIKMYY